MSSFIVCGFYTRGTGYKEEIKNLRASCEKFKLEHDLVEYESRGEWVRNCAIKPEFIHEMLVKHSDRNVVYLDADAVIQKYPILFHDMDADLAVHYKEGRELLSGTIFLRNSPKMQMFTRYWINLQCQNPRKWDQRILQLCVIKYKESMQLKVVNLPPSYTQIFDSMKKHGEPVIEHFQASRRLKQILDPKLLELIPKVVQGQRTRIAPDGTFFLTRTTPAIEKELSENFCKFPNEYRWYPKTTGSIKPADFRKYFEGKTCYIVGKGPSLDLLQAKDFTNPDCPIICINEAIHKIESLDLPNPLFMLQQDAWLKDSCRPKKESTAVFLAHSCQHWYSDVPSKFCFHYTEINLKKNSISVVYAIAIAKMCGCSGYKLFAFDASVNADVNYADVIGYSPTNGGNPNRFLGHRLVILKHAGDIPVEFYMPANIPAESICR